MGEVVNATAKAAGFTPLRIELPKKPEPQAEPVLPEEFVVSLKLVVLQKNK
jgi:hypothetical protein